MGHQRQLRLDLMLARSLEGFVEAAHLESNTCSVARSALDWLEMTFPASQAMAELSHADRLTPRVEAMEKALALALALALVQRLDDVARVPSSCCR